MRIFLIVMLTLLTVSGMVQSCVAGTKEQVKQRGVLHCGVSTGVPGFSTADEQGNWVGFDVEFCKAVAAAVLGDAGKVKYIPLPARSRFTGLQTGQVDLLARNSGWSLARDTAMGLHVVAATYYDSQGFLVPADKKIITALDLADKQVCVQYGTSSARRVADFFFEQELEYTPVIYETAAEAVAGLAAGQCDAVGNDVSILQNFRAKQPQPESLNLLPETIAKKYHGPMVRQGDDNWFNIVRWSYFTLIAAEEYGITSLNIDGIRSSARKPALKSLLGLEGIKGESMGLSDDWSYQIIKQVGNYGELFQRTLGQDSPHGTARGLNRLWSSGGLHHAPSFR